MTYVILRHHQQPENFVELTSGEITLGRSANNHICLDDTTVSGHHAKIFTYFCVSYIEDLDSTNGTYVNGKRVKKHLLKPGDNVHLGKYQFTVELLQAAANESKRA